ncbi:GntR family transcriptional repressor for pyruvate dehydrogenase complex [Streptomyces sp. Amel2xB2]|uniref:FadR/GntR family transcriptional regulator n=1 Tax=Streptomyces sp. Amel2xB2 TaxID=1305829 RepID=UPI000DB9574C|nr:FadR/GntR family transcriptional regulator [Streptomyces sp. Amel2xB2]RAJ65678.1 GntR family transcriptional repressor for pyruvate dehydrogenase complex [Streptomyces sp. Amel2xB2]
MTDDALRPMARPRLYEQVLDRLRAYAVDHELSAGDRLPPERELAQRLGVSRSSVKQAVVVLEVQGLVETRHGGGTYLVRDTLDAEPVERLVERQRRLPDVLEAREALETKLAELAAERRTEEDLEAMRDALSAMESDIADGGHGVEGDRRFHAAVTAAGHSTLLAEFMRSISESIAESRTESLRQPGRPTRSLDQHARILAAVERGDGKAAAAAMRRHVRTVAKVRLLEWNPDEDGKDTAADGS